MATREHMDATLFALSNGTRRTILNRLAESPATYKELETVVPIRHNNIRKQIDVLVRAGLVTIDKEGQAAMISLNTKRVGEAIRWLEGEHRRWLGKSRTVRRTNKITDSPDETIDMRPEDIPKSPEI